MPTCRVVLIALVLVIPTAFAPAGEIHVAPGGDDANPGTAARPVATLVRARDAARAVIAKGLAEDLHVIVHGGTYRLAEPLVFGPQDGGTAVLDVIWRAAEGTSPVLSGGRVIGGWKQDGEVWRTTVPEVKAGAWRFNELFVGGERRPRARHPNEGWARVDSVVDDRWKFTWKEGEVPALAEPGEAQLLLLHDWSVTRVRIASMDSGSRTLTTADRIGGPARFWRVGGFEPHPRYRLENHPALLDAPGEWYLDTKTGVLTYHPVPGETPGEVEVVAPVAPQLLVVRGDPDGGKPVRNLHLRGLTFEHALWMPPGGRYAGMQACYHWQGEARGKEDWGNRKPVTPAVEFIAAEDCALTGCRLRHLGGSGLWFGRGCHGCALRAAVVEDVAGNGVMIGEGGAKGPAVAKNIHVSESRVLRCGQRFFGAVGVWVGITDGTHVARSEIAHHPYTGVSVGWQWNPKPTACRDNLVSANHIHHCMQILSDGGGIYTLGRQPGTRLVRNHIHDIPLNAGRAESNGMFLDEGTTEIVIEENLIHDTVRSPFRFHKARENLVKDNIVTLRQGVPIVRYNATAEKYITLKGNTVVPHDDRGEAFKKALERMRRETGPPR